MSLVFTNRLSLPEKMDTDSLSPEEMREILRALETINNWLGGTRATLWHLNRYARRWPADRIVRLIDWGTGGADLPRAIVRWARRRSLRVEITGVDNNPLVIDYAREACRDYPEIQVIEGELTQLPLPLEPFDYAISSLCLHHLSDETIVHLLSVSDRLARRGILMNDLKRSVRAWTWIWALSRLGRAHPVVRHDGPLSVRNAFTARELRNYARLAGVLYTNVYTHFGYRLMLAGEKGEADRIYERVR